MKLDNLSCLYALQQPGGYTVGFMSFMDVWIIDGDVLKVEIIIEQSISCEKPFYAKRSQ